MTFGRGKCSIRRVRPRNLELSYRVVVDRPRATAEIRRAIRRTGGDLTAAGELLGVTRFTLRKYVEALGLSRALEVERAASRIGWGRRA